ncbi:alpha/beta fold hydrolase [Bosea sp. 117]|uniref:alpha/beta fold hydrolase n=1 Tax=Bosea sp. 117 TaxID=1125973 RepID=UPI000493F015|nr:alpha/beta fold hydrolase [Bosea sp. 117]
MEFVASGEARIAARVDGPAHLPWIVLSNSLAADHTMWDDQIAMLTARRRVLRYDTRGHGKSGAPPGPYDFDMLVGDVVALMDHFGIERADYLGLSLGGMTGLGLGLAHPDRVGRLVCADARADAPAPFVAGWDQRIAAVEANGTQAVVAGTLERWFTPATHRDRPEIVARTAAMIRGTSPVGYIGCGEALKRLDYLRRLPDLAAETLYLVGAEDLAAPAEAMRAMAEATPKARFGVLPGCAHIANMEDAAGFNARVATFLDGA